MTIILDSVLAVGGIEGLLSFYDLVDNTVLSAIEKAHFKTKKVKSKDDDDKIDTIKEGKAVRCTHHF
jgi:hypothetical protein